MRDWMSFSDILCSMMLNIFKYLYITPKAIKDPTDMVQIVTDDTFQGFVESNPVAVIDCWAAWCGPCRFLSPVIDQLSEENKDVAFGKLNVDENALVPVKYGIMSIPTLLYFKDGELVNRTVGALPKKAIEDALAKIAGQILSA